MRLTVNTKLFFESILAPVDREKFIKRYGKKDFPWGIEVSLYDKHTCHQRGAVWRDYQIAAELLYTSKELIYEKCRTSKELNFNPTLVRLKLQEAPLE